VKFKLCNEARCIFQPSKVPPKVHILSWAHISFKINMSLIHKTCALPPPPQRINSALPGGRAPQFGNLRSSLTLLSVGYRVCFRFKNKFCVYFTVFCSIPILFYSVIPYVTLGVVVLVYGVRLCLELRPTTGLCLIPQIYESEEPRW
jgi:hypothetical protein